MDLKDIGRLIQKRRDTFKLRQEDLAELSKVTTKTVHLLEQGIGNPSFSTLKSIADVLGLDIELKIKQVN